MFFSHSETVGGIQVSCQEKAPDALACRGRSHHA